MTVEEFDNTSFSKDSKVIFRGEVFPVISVNFLNKTITYDGNPGSVRFDVRKDCEALELAKDDEKVTISHQKLFCREEEND